MKPRESWCAALTDAKSLTVDGESATIPIGYECTHKLADHGLYVGVFDSFADVRGLTDFASVED